MKLDRPAAAAEPTATDSFRDPVRFAILVTLVLGAWMAVVDFALPPFRSWQADSDALVTESTRRSLEAGIGFVGGFMTSADTTVHRRAVIAIDPRLAARRDLPYVAQYGLQYKVVAALAPRNPALLSKYFVLARLIGIFAFAATLAALIARIRLDAGLAAAMTSLGCLMLSPYLIAMAHTLYWAPTLLFLPFVVSFVAWERVRGPAGRALFYTVIGALVFLKSLCGYEFLTNVAGSVAVGIVYTAFKQGRPLRSTVGSLILAAVASVTGFVLAGVLHFLQARAYFGDDGMAFRALTLPMHYVTSGAAGIRVAPLGVSGALKTVVVYLNRPAVGVVSVQTVLALLAAATALYLALRGAGLTRAIPTTRGIGIEALLKTAWVGLPISLLWWIAFKHMVYHPHINTIIFYLPMFPLAFAALGAVGDAVGIVCRSSARR